MPLGMRRVGREESGAWLVMRCKHNAELIVLRFLVSFILLETSGEVLGASLLC